MSLSLRLVIFTGALLIFANVLNYIRRKKILMANSTGWVCIASFLLLVSIFPGTIMWVSRQLGFQSPSNFVFFVVTGLLIVKTFRDSARISLMTHKVEELTQEVALAQIEQQERCEEDADRV